MTNAIKTMEQKFEMNVKNMDGILKIICSKLDNNKKQLTNMQASVDSIKIDDIIDSIEEIYDDINERIKTQILANIANINKKLDDLEKNNNSYALNGIIIDCDNNIITSKKQYDAAISKNNIRIIFDDGVIEITPQPKKRGRKN
jgi:sugar-specific transcriptional regulator TrmB